MQQLTDQEAFDKVVNHLRRQNRQAFDGICLYRGPDNTSCAVGCLIPDELYDEGMEGNTASDLLHHNFDDVPFPFRNVNPTLLMKLQEAHDSPDYRDDGFNGIKKSLIEVARKFNLNLNPQVIHAN